MNDKPGSFGHPSQPWPGDYLLVAHWLHLFFGNGLSTSGFYCAERTMLIQGPPRAFPWYGGVDLPTASA